MTPDPFHNVPVPGYSSFVEMTEDTAIPNPGSGIQITASNGGTVTLTMANGETVIVHPIIGDNIYRYPAVKATVGTATVTKYYSLA